MQRGLRCLVVKYGDPGEGRMRVGRKGISARKQKKTFPMLGGRKTVICEFLGTGMISVMPVPLLSVHPREYSQ